MCCGGKQPKKPNPLEKQFKQQRKKFTKTEFQLLRKVFNDLSSRSRGETMAKDDFIRFFPLTGLWGERMFERFDLMRTENINLEEFIIGLGNSAKLSPDEQIRYLFDVYDLTSTNCITKVELLMMLYNYPQDDLQVITKDPYFKNMVNKKQEIGTEEPSFNATSQFFQSQIKDFMSSRYSNHTQQNNNQQSQFNEKNTNNKNNNKVFQAQDDDDIGKEEENLPQFNLEDRTIADCAKNHKVGQRNSKFLEISQTKPKEESVLKPSDIQIFPRTQAQSESISHMKKSQPKLEKHTNIPAKASNVNNVIKQYCDFVFREYDTDSLSYENFSTWCIEHYTVFNIFKNTFYFGFWGEEDGIMQYTYKQLDMSGYLHKLRKRKDNKLVKYYYELRENFLVYFLEKGQKPKGMICLDGLIVKENDANEFENNNELKKKMQGYAGFEIAHKDDYYKSKFLYCRLEERHQWLQCMGEYSKYNFYDHYTIQEKIGLGRFSTVYKGKKKNPKEGEPLYYAIKVMITGKLTKDEIQFISYETETMRFLQHPGIIKVDKTMQDKHNIYIITELVSGGDLFDYIHNREFLEEVEASALMKQLFATVLYIHDAGIIHRDLKPENILVVKGNEKDKEGRQIAKQIKIIDFGFSKMLQVGQMCEGFCGSENYIAPEIIQNQLYNMKVDNFALGCIMFLMLRGSLPFDSLITDEISQNTIYGKYSLVDDHWNNVSPQAKDLITQLLKVDPNQRISTRDALQHEWIRNRKDLEKYKGKNPHNIWKNEEGQSQVNQSQFQ